MKISATHRFSDKLKHFLKQGTSPKSLSLSITLALLLGIFPVLGVTTWVITLLAIRLQLNLALMMTLAYAIWPAQVMLIVPFLRIGEWLHQAPPFPLSLESMQAALAQSFSGAMEQFWDINVFLASGWLFASIPMGLLLYFSLLPIFRYFLRKKMDLGSTEPLNA